MLQQLAIQLLECFRFYGKPFVYVKKVIAVTCNGASPNRKLYQMHCHLTQYDDMKPETDVIYCARNLFSGTKNIFLYFSSNVPYFLKTAQNCLSNYGSGKVISTCGRADVFIIEPLLTYFTKIKNVDFPKSCIERIKVRPYSIMNVKLAAQVLSLLPVSLMFY